MLEIGFADVVVGQRDQFSIHILRSRFSIARRRAFLPLLTSAVLIRPVGDSSLLHKRGLHLSADHPDHFFLDDVLVEKVLFQLPLNAPLFEFLEIFLDLPFGDDLLLELHNMIGNDEHLIVQILPHLLYLVLQLQLSSFALGDFAHMVLNCLLRFLKL